MTDDPQLEVIHQMLTNLESQLDRIGERISILEDSQKTMSNFINECQGGRKVLLYVIGGLGAIGALTITLIEKIAK